MHPARRGIRGWLVAGIPLFGRRGCPPDGADPRKRCVRGPDRPLWVFFALAFAISWTALGALQAIALGSGLEGWQDLSGRAETTFDLGVLAGTLAAPLWSVRLLNLVADFGPSLAAVIVAAGSGGVKPLLRRLGRWRVGGRWYLVAFGLPVAVMGGAIGIYALLGGELGAVVVGSGTLVSLVGWLLPRTLGGGGLGEELGWRGFALPRLQARMGAVSAAALLGVVWTLWHLPLVLVSRSPLVQGAALLLFGAPMSFVYAWILNGTGGSVLLPVLLHGTQNGLSAFLERSLVPGLLDADGWVLFRIALLLGVAIAAAIAVARQQRLGRIVLDAAGARARPG